MKVANQRDLAAGLLYGVIGATVAIASTGYRMGVAASMGPGYFPFWLGVLLTTTGVALTITAIRSREEQRTLGRWDIRTLAIIFISVTLFGTLLNSIGLVLAIILLICVSSYASREFTWRGTLATTCLLLALSILVFIYGLGLVIPLWPPILAN